jgi:integrase
MRPGEVFVMRWEYVLLREEESGLIRVVDWKSKAARRVLPVTPRVYALLKARHKDQRYPFEVWVFPTQSKHGHLEVQKAKRQHATRVGRFGRCSVRALRSEAHGAYPAGQGGAGDVFALAKIAGHSSITITQKYVHPEEETIDDVFSRLDCGECEETSHHKSLHSQKKAAKRLAAGIAK